MNNQEHNSLVPFPLEYALYQIPVSPARRSRASWNPQLEVTFQYRQDYLEPVLVEELQHWGFQPNGQCYCGCRQPTGSYFASGHDSRFASNLLAALRDAPNVRQAIQGLAEQGLG